MPNLKLTLACWDYDRTRPLIDGRVKPEGIDLDIQILRPRADLPAHAGQPGIPGLGAVARVLHGAEGARATARSWRCRWRCRKSSATPASMCATAPASRRRQDLRGKRVGTSQYSSTGLVLHARHAGARLRRQVRGHALVHGRAQHLRRAAADPAQPAEGDEARLPVRHGQTLEKMFDAGELDALLSLYIPQAVPRRRAAHRAAVPELQGGRARTTTAAPRSSRSCTPWWCARTCTASIPGWRRASTRRSARRKAIAVDGLYDTDALQLALPLLIDHVEETWRVFGKDFWAYGLEPNRPTWEAIAPVRARAGPRAARGHAGGDVSGAGRMRRAPSLLLATSAIIAHDLPLDIAKGGLPCCPTKPTCPAEGSLSPLERQPRRQRRSLDVDLRREHCVRLARSRARRRSPT